MVRVSMSPHAVQRAIDMGMDGSEIRAVLLCPRDRLRLPNGRERWTRGKVSLVVAADGAGWTVVTVLWATAAAWVEDAESTASRGEGTFVAEQMRRARRAMKAGKRRARHG